MEKLKNEQLKSVAGGASTVDIEAHKGPKVGRYNLVVGNKYIFEVDVESINYTSGRAAGLGNTVYYVGICTRSYEKEGGIYGNTFRTHVVRLEDGTEKEIQDDGCTVYQYI